MDDLLKSLCIMKGKKIISNLTNYVLKLLYLKTEKINYFLI